MSKKIINDKLTKQKDCSLKNFDYLLSSYISSGDSRLQKKASLLAYWIDEYARYIKNEDSFDSKKLKSYKRGDIIKLNFGFNVGSECGGLHYAIVANNNNPHNSSVITVIPLTSTKEGSSVHPNDVFLGNEIYTKLKLKSDTIYQNLEKEREEIDKMNSLFNSLMASIDQKLSVHETLAEEKPSEALSLLNDARRYLDTAKELKYQWDIKSEKNAEHRKQLDKIKQEISRMKSGSIAQVEQITTVSKMRIYDPRNAQGVLSGIRLSSESLDKINDKIKELFVF